MSYDTPLYWALGITIPSLLAYVLVVKRFWRWLRTFTIIKRADWDALHKELRALQSANAMLTRNMYVTKETHGQMRLEAKMEQPPYFYSGAVPGGDGHFYVQQWHYDDWLQFKQDKVLVMRNRRRVWVTEPIKGDELVDMNRYPPYRWVPEEQVYGKANNGKSHRNGKRLQRAVRAR